MRFLLLVVGSLLLALGAYVVAYGPGAAHPNKTLLVQIGAVFFAAGAVAVDVVEAIKRRDGT